MQFAGFKFKCNNFDKRRYQISFANAKSASALNTFNILPAYYLQNSFFMCLAVFQNYLSSCKQRGNKYARFKTSENTAQKHD